MLKQSFRILILFSFFLLAGANLFQHFVPDSYFTISKYSGGSAKIETKKNPDFFCTGTDYRFAFGEEVNSISLGSNFKNDTKKSFSYPLYKKQIQFFKSYFCSDFMPHRTIGYFFIYILFHKLLL